MQYTYISFICKLPKTIFRFIWHFLSQFKLPVSFYVFLSFITGFWGPFNSILIKTVIDLLPQVQNKDLSILFIPVGFIVLNFLVFDNVTWIALTYIRAKFIPVIINNMIGSSMNYVLDHSYQIFQDNLSGKISKQITNLADGTEKLITSVASNFLRGASILFATFVTAYFVNPIFCLILVTWFVLFG